MSEHEISVTVNGERHELAVEPRTLLVTALRDELGYTGANVGCETGRCGTCTVAVNGETIKSCTRLAVQTDGAEIETVEGLADDGDLTPLQESFQEHHGLQCGYCTPGMLLSADALLATNDDPTREEIREAIEGNLCRCTGYQNIVDAIEATADRLGERR
ncbi:2Fe-2S iron-sulfur cluster binding domain-containing protein [Natronorubrum sp. JWXQ-INN-674]|uniref:2Fe-2S iron-sulfur cluster binding domain-containing protein n=1 Tax=Natronorubrum halalkaliphilum TaxID=2691917 RepID=A0A6B0VK58_9EURY|nr:(2Fe-2S)-binding protein [Natronorubrum halalkaliphilum]MXV61386.1 2Fe-2S iron-sulfur cluster binding domain-containing protein [Natronorubrum halalkaliphilum]